MTFDIGQIIQQRIEDQQNQLNQLQQQQTKPQGGILNQIDPAWLALAQGFLAPTKTGGFGESLANAAGQLQGPLAQMKQQQLSAQDKIDKLKESQAKLAMDWYKAQSGGSDDYMDAFRQLRNEKMIESLFAPEMRQYDAVLGKITSTDEEKADAQAKKDALQQKIDEYKAQHGIGARPRVGAGTQSQPQQQTGDLTKDEVLRAYPDAVQEGGKWVVIKDGKKYQVSR